MNFYVDSGGVMIGTDPERVFQGSAMANTVRLIGAFPSSASVLVGYTLPDGTKTLGQLMTFNKELSGVISANNGVKLSIWEQKIGVKYVLQDDGSIKAMPDYTVLEQTGKVTVHFTITQADNNGTPITLATAASSFICEKGTPLEMPSEAFDEYESLLNQILAQLSAINEKVDTDHSEFKEGIQALQDEKVNRSGDTMTGPLEVQNASDKSFKTRYTENGSEIIDNDNRGKTSYKNDGIVYNDGSMEVEFLFPEGSDGGTLALEGYVEEKLDGVVDELRAEIATVEDEAVDISQVGAANGVAPLDESAKIPSDYLPSYVDDVIEFSRFVYGTDWLEYLLTLSVGTIVFCSADTADLVGGEESPYYQKFLLNTDGTEEGLQIIAPEKGKIYVNTHSGKIYRWSGSGLFEISDILKLGETSSSAYPGNKGKANAEAIAALQETNPIMIDLGNSYEEVEIIQPDALSNALKVKLPKMTGTQFKQAWEAGKRAVMTWVEQVFTEYPNRYLSVVESCVFDSEDYPERYYNLYVEGRFEQGNFVIRYCSDRNFTSVTIVEHWRDLTNIDRALLVDSIKNNAKAIEEGLGNLTNTIMRVNDEVWAGINADRTRLQSLEDKSIAIIECTTFSSGYGCLTKRQITDILYYFQTMGTLVVIKNAIEPSESGHFNYVVVVNVHYRASIVEVTAIGNDLENKPKSIIFGTSVGADDNYIANTIVRELVLSTDYASTDGTVAGLLAVNKNKGIGRENLSPVLEIIRAEDSEILEKTSRYKPITPSNLDYAVKAGVTTNTETLTAEEKAAACEWIGATKLYKHTITASTMLYIYNTDSTPFTIDTLETALIDCIAARDDRGNFITYLTRSGDTTYDVTGIAGTLNTYTIETISDPDTVTEV